MVGSGRVRSGSTVLERIFSPIHHLSGSSIKSRVRVALAWSFVRTLDVNFVCGNQVQEPHGGSDAPATGTRSVESRRSSSPHPRQSSIAPDWSRGTHASRADSRPTRRTTLGQTTRRCADARPRLTNCTHRQARPQRNRSSARGSPVAIIEHHITNITSGRDLIAAHAYHGCPRSSCEGCMHVSGTGHSGADAYAAAARNS